MRKGAIFFVSQLILSILIISTANAQENWSWINPLPQGNDLRGICFLDENTGWAAGGKGTIIKTTDGGFTWTMLNTPTLGELNAVQFINSAVGYAVGDSSVILKTTDGGISWTKYNANHFYIKDIFFLDENTGYAGGSDCVLKTTNGGATWERHYQDWSWTWINSIFFTSEEVGYYAGYGGPKRTINGGVEFEYMGVPGASDYMDIFFLNDSTGWVLGDRGEVFNCTDATSGWPTWTQIATTVSTRQLFFKDENTGWALGYNQVSKTTDGGYTWSDVLLSEYMYNFSYYSGKLWAVGDGGKIYKSTDEGATWIASYSNYAKNINVNSVQFNDPLNGCAVGKEGLILTTSDGGLTWTNRNCPVDVELYSVEYADAENIFVSGCGALLKSTNGGSSWQIKYTSTYTHLYDLDFRNSMEGIAAGDDILFTSDCGNTWAVVDQHDMKGASFITVDKAIMVGDNGDAYVSDDGGSTWSETSLPTSENLKKVRFLDETSGFIVGEKGVILKTVDGGISWSIASYNNNYSLNDIFIIDTYNIFAVGGDQWGSNKNYISVVLKSTDGGDSWNLLQNHSDKTIFSEFFSDVNNGFITGEDCMIMKYTNNIDIPAYPTGLTASRQGDSIILHWNDNSGNETGFKILRRDPDNCRYTRIATVGMNLTEYTDSDLNSDGEYWYRIKAYNNNGESSSSREDSVYIPAVVLPAPELVYPPNNSIDIPTSVTLIWNASTGAEKYHLQVSLNPGFSYLSLEESGLSSTSFSISGLGTTNLYYWRVKAISSTVHSDWSEVWDFTTASSPPYAPYLIFPDEGSKYQPLTPLLVWSETWNAITYRLQLSTSIDFGNIIYDDSTLTGTSAQVGPLAYNTVYYWRVSAKNSGGYSDYSDIRNFMTQEDTDWDIMSCYSSCWFQSVYFIDENNGWTTGWGGEIYKTTDGGISWFLQPHAISSYLLLESVHFPDALHGYIAGSNGIVMKTTDGGNVWNASGTGTVEDLNAVFFTDSNTGWIAGDNKTILKTTDGGTSWINQLSGTYPSLRDLYFINSQTGWAVGGGILKTTDGGANWFELGDIGLVNAVYFIDEIMGWVAGYDGIIYCTTDGGTSWIEQSSNVEVNLEDICFADENTGWAAGDEGTILKTADGGNSWHKLECGISENLNSICFYDESTVWAVGRNGMILKTTNGGGIISDVDDYYDYSSKPEQLYLYQNYPNPFNPVTTIEFDIPENVFVSLTIYDNLGRILDELVRKQMSPGRYRVAWNAGNYNSGVYFCRLQIGKTKITNKMVLLK